MLRIGSRVAAVMLIGAGAFGGCGDPLGPEDLAGDFVMTRAGSTSIPGRVRVSDVLAYDIVFDSVTLRADGTARTSLRYLIYWPPHFPSLATASDEWTYEYVAPIGRIKLTQRTCAPNTPCNVMPRDPLFFTIRGDDLLRDEAIGPFAGTWSRRAPTAAQ